jgi:hypothetical protein
MFAAYERFMAGEPLANGRYEEIGTDLGGVRQVLAEVTQGDLRARGSRDGVAGRALLWIDNAQHTWQHVVDATPVGPAGGALTVQFLPEGAYIAEWWDTARGSQARSERHTVAGDGLLTLQVGGLAGDVAVRLVRVGDAFPAQASCGDGRSICLPMLRR